VWMNVCNYDITEYPDSTKTYIGQVDNAEAHRSNTNYLFYH